MASRPTARSSRAAIRQVRAPLESVWITDSILASAFERYCKISRLSRRKSSSVPGPLENRRRLGMRRMTGLYSSDFQPTLPPWMLEYPADLSQWTWTAPNPVEERLSRTETHEVSPSALSHLWRFLAPAAAEPTQGEPVQREDVIQVEGHGPSSILDRACEALCRSRSLPNLGDEYIQVMRGLEQDTYLGVVSAVAIPDLFAQFRQKVAESINRALDHQTGLSSSDAKEVVRRASGELVAAIIRGLSLSRVQGLEQLEPSACNTLLTTLAELPKTEEAILLFQMFMRSVEESYAKQVSTGIEANIRSWFRRDGKTPEAIVACLADGRLDMGEGTRLLDTAAALVTKLCDMQQRTACLHTHSAWLSLLAHNPQISEAYFGDALARYTTAADHWDCHRDRHVCELMVCHWRSRKYLRPNFNPDRRSLGYLLYSLDSYRVRQSMMALVRRMEAQNVLLRSITKYCEIAPHLSGRRLRWMAIASNDHRMVLSLLDLTKLHRGKILDTTWRSFRMVLLAHVKDMIQDERVEVGRVWELMNSVAENDEAMLRLKTEMMRAMPAWFASAKHLGDRAMLRNISRCNAWLRSRGETPGPDSILALSRACVRDLKRGEAGRFARHGWLVRLATECLGDVQGARLAATLHDWQGRNMASQRSSF